MQLENMSEELKDLLHDIKQVQESSSGFRDSRGYSAEFDSWGSKQYTANTIAEAQNCHWLEFDKESKIAIKSEYSIQKSYFKTGDNEEDHCFGVSFIKIKDRYLRLIVDV